MRPMSCALAAVGLISELLDVMELVDATLERNNLIFDVIIVLVD